MLGSEENAVHTATISGGVHATNAMTVEIHFSTINGGVDIQGGSGPFGGPFEVTFNTVEDSTINGGYTESGYDGFWNGFFRNNVHGPVNFYNNVVRGSRRQRVSDEHDSRQSQLLRERPGASVGRLRRRDRTT